MSINGISGNSPVQPTQNITPKAVGDVNAATHTSAADRLELSGMSHLMKSLRANADVRTDKVADVKAQIDAGTYDIDGAKLNASMDRLLDDLTA